MRNKYRTHSHASSISIVAVVAAVYACSALILIFIKV